MPRLATIRLTLLITLSAAALLMGACGGKNGDAVCGDGVVGGNEECDDGNLFNGDGCNAICQSEGPSCGDEIIQGDEECDDGNTEDGDGCDADCMLEVAPGCGNGVREVTEACDDGNVTDCDGCSATCTVETCGNGVTECDEDCDDANTIDGDGCDDCSFPNVSCGNGAIDPGEECDDGNNVSGDGCDADCNTEWMPACGNGVLEAGEECDDDNLVDCDGCSAHCDTEGCGNGVIECAEACDDGNTADGDGCSAACTVEGTPGCGNGVLEVGETCDDGNLTACDGCSSSCTAEACGNGVIECAEACDDGNIASGDGCSDTCAVEGVPGCGNGVLEVGEACDDGNLTACDGCSAGCDVEACGNSVVECNEECDDGNTSSGDGCSDTCVSEIVPTCGNGTVETGEQCDDGNSSNTDACLNSCLNASCGDGHIQVGQEGCDDSNTASGDGCSSTCQLELCGNGTPDAGEGCDDGNGINTDGCPDGPGGTCQPATCGDGFIQASVEACDDGNTSDGDGCSALCAIETVQCTVAQTLSCGDDDSGSNGGAGSTDLINTYGCLSWDESGPEIAYAFTATTNESVTVGISAMTANLDLFVIDDQGGLCDPTNCLDADDSSVTFAAVTGTTYYLVVDGFGGAVGDYTITVVCPSTPGCGNGIVEGTEACDDGNFDDTDTCVTGCLNASCGDGFVQAGVEECDDGNANNADGCRNDCTAPACGDGLLDSGEQCDDGNTNDGDGCSAACVPEYCNDDYTLSCGGSDNYNNSYGGSTNVLTTYGCIPAWDESGPEYTYVFTAQNSGVVNVDLNVSTAGQDLDVFVISDAGGLCAPTSCLAYGDSQASFMAVAGETYYIVVDGFGGDVADYTVTLLCGVCGDNSLDFGEECDDGNTTSGDGCDGTCELEGVECAPGLMLSCGDSDTWHNRGGGHTDNITGYSCNTWDESGPEFTYFFSPTNSGDVTVDLTGMTANLDLYVLSDNNFTCEATNCLDYGDDTVTFTAVGGDVYYFVVDGANGAEGDYTIGVSCTNP